MASLSGAIQQLAAEIILRDRTGEGAASAAANFGKVADAAGGAAQVVEKTTEISESAERAYQRLARRLDPLAAATERYRKDEESLNRARALGVISGEQLEKNLRQLQTQYERTKDRIEKTERAQQGLNASMGETESIFARIGRGASNFLAPVAAAVAAISIATQRAVSDLAKLADEAKALGGVGQAGFLQEARFALGQQGFEESDVDKLLTTFNRNLGALKLDTGPLDKVLSRIEGGAQLTQQLKGVKDIGAAYEIYIQRLSEVEDAQVRANLAVAAFGKDLGPKLAAAAGEGVEGFRELAARARELGLVIDDSVIRRADELDDRLKEATDVIKVQMRRAFVELGPVIVGIAEFVADIFRRIANYAAEISARYGNVSKTNSLDDLERQRADAQKRLADIAAAKAGPGAFADPFRIEEKTIARLAEIDKRIKEVTASAQASVPAFDAGAAGLAGFGDAAGDAADELDKARARLDAAKGRFEAAQKGQKSLEAFDRNAAADAIVAASGLIGQQADELKRLNLEAADYEKKTQEIGKAWGKVGGAVKSAADEVKRAADPRAVDEFLDAAAIGDAELARVRERRDLEKEIAEIKVKAAAAVASGDDGALKQLASELAVLEQSLADRAPARAEERSADRFADNYRRALYDVADDFVRRLAQGDLNSFRDFARGLKNILIDSVLAPFRNAFASTISNLFSGAIGGGGFSIFTPGIGGGQSPAGRAGGFALPFGGFNPAALAQAALGFGGIAAGGASQIFGLASLIGPGALGRFGAGVGNFLGLSGNLTGGLSKALAGAGTFGGALGGIGGSLLSGSLFGRSTGQSIGSTIGGIAGNLIPIPVLGPLIGSFLGGAIGSLFGGKPSDNAAGGAINFSTFASEGQFAKNNNAQNIEARDQLLEATAALARQLTQLTGATLAGPQISIQVGSRDGTVITTGRGGRVTTPVGDVQAAQNEIVRQLSVSLEGGDSVLVAAAKELAAAKIPVDDLVQRLTNLKAVLADPNEFVDPLKEQTAAIVEAFAGLNTSSGELKKAFDDAIDRLASNVNEETRQALVAADNPQLAAIEQLLKEQAARRAAIDELVAKGGNVDGSLVREFQRRQLLNQFNTGDRFNQATDPAAFAIQQLIDAQADERAAFRKAIEGSGGLLTEADFLGLLRAQEAERFNAFRGLSDEDKIRLAGRGDDFTDLTKQYALAVERLIAETAKLTENFEAERQRLQGVIGARAGEVSSLGLAIDRLDTRNALGTPGESLSLLRSQLEDLGNRALSGDETTKANARAALPQAVEAYVNRLEQVSASGTATQNGAAFARDLLVRVRDRASEEKTIAERQLAELETSREVLEEIRDIMARPQLDIGALVAAAGGLSADNPVAILALELAELEARQTAQTDRLVAAIEALSPADVGLTAGTGSATPTSLGIAPSAGQTFAAAGLTNSPASAAASATATASNSAAGANDDVANGLFAIADAVDNQTRVIVDLDKRRAERDVRNETYLKAIATRRTGTL